MSIEQKQGLLLEMDGRVGNRVVEPFRRGNESSINSTFLDYVKNPELPEGHPDSGKVTYDLPTVESFCRVSGEDSSTLVLVRESTEAPACLPCHYFVVTADLDSCTLWSVSKIIPFKQVDKYGIEQISLELVLKNDELPPSVERQSSKVDQYFDELWSLRESHEKTERVRAAAVGETRIILQQQGCWLIKPHGTPEMLEDLRTINSDNQYRNSEVEEPEADSQVIIVAA